MQAIYHTASGSALYYGELGGGTPKPEQNPSLKTV